jgi:hypothetical protein
MHADYVQYMSVNIQVYSSSPNCSTLKTNSSLPITMFNYISTGSRGGPGERTTYVSCGMILCTGTWEVTEEY